MPSTATAPSGRNPWVARLGGLAVAAATLALMIATEPALAIVWDEGYTLGREARVRAWIEALRDPPGFARRWSPPTLELVQRDDRVPSPKRERLATRAGLLAADVLAWFWPFAREEPHGHPPFYAIVGLVGDLLAPSWDTLPRARLGTMIAFSVAAGAIFAAWARRRGPWAGGLAAGAWALQPRLFAEGHYATYDALLASLWVVATITFARAVDPGAGKTPDRLRWPSAILLGILIGWAADTKLTGWLLPIPLLAWTALARDRRGLLTLLVAAPVAILTLYAFNPAFWPDPVGGVERFLRSNLGRANTRPIPILFLGEVIETPTESLPWYNTLAWTVFVTPVGFLALAIVGALMSCRHLRREPLGALATGGWAFLLILRSLPHTPGHDGVRQFLPAFGCLAVVAGLGAAGAVERLGRRGKVVVVAALIEGAASVALIMPVPLSYYSPVVGGLPGAAALGMEPTYYWDALDAGALDWLNRNTPPGQTVRFATYPTSWLELRRAGRLRAGLWRIEPGEMAYYVVQNRPGALGPIDRALIARSGSRHVLASKFGVPLIWAFPSSEFEAVGGVR
ncbi:MAG TPA: glycosyltransferase family 39 protein [Isosphaeraceae bacterium]|jgi:4-amino-4-deoxy-L-arabinose transferase-like glycosyltransferase|nr:glycosyltransferase family 39 protein [Isosphaeraceae bacterium]